eukprot:GHVQ01041689.1.p1 GENE.GHVQ01041689.1~~GHVQ01041689.1.p1  ORF type:complete len:187 (+),score=27.97 GHVQ01041689.1:374-934(+)
MELKFMALHSCVRRRLQLFSVICLNASLLLLGGVHSETTSALVGYEDSCWHNKHTSATERYVQVISTGSKTVVEEEGSCGEPVNPIALRRKSSSLAVTAGPPPWVTRTATVIQRTAIPVQPIKRKLDVTDQSKFVYAALTERFFEDVLCIIVTAVIGNYLLHWYMKEPLDTELDATKKDERRRLVS